MEPAFWLDRWHRHEIGFHQAEVNPRLIAHWPDLGCTPGAEVFVPLCGKSRDMLWLAGQGHSVLGVEVSPVAVADFFSENALSPQRRDLSPFESWQYEDITILQGDYFDLRPEHLAGTGAAFDRASLIALPPPMRRQYAHHFARIVPPEAPVLLVTLEYPQHEMDGPPFSVSEEEVHSLYADVYNVHLISQHDVWAQTPRFQEKGLTALVEKIYRLERSC